MKAFQCCRFYSCILLTFMIKRSEGVLFLARPGDGEESVYSPVNVNATLHCAVNNTNLAWDVDGLSLDSPVQGPQLNLRGIFQSGPTTSSDGVTSSSVIVFGNRELKNNTRICCQSFVNELNKNCTTLIIYDKPSPPTNLSVIVTNAGGSDLINISWMATPMMGVDQNYMIVLDMYTLETTQFYYIYQQNTSDIKCSAYVIAVNGAGESDPSNNVSIPSLPDIGPVTASLTHQVWKCDGGIRVNISFEEAQSCVDQPVLNYLLSFQNSTGIYVLFYSNETEVMLGPQDGLEDNQKFVYTITAINSVGNATSQNNSLFTSDVQAVNATVVDESTIDIHCWFIHGSDALGCKVVLVSDHPGVNNETMNITRNNIMTASGTFNSTQPVYCYNRVFAFDIEINNTFSNVDIEGVFQPTATTNSMCSVEGSNPPPLAVPIAIVTVVLIIVIVTIIIFIIVIMRHKKGICSWNSRSDDISTSINKKDPPLTKQSPPSHETLQSSSSKSSLPHSQNDIPSVLTDNGSGGKEPTIESTSSPCVPLYALPNKLRQKDKSDISYAPKEEKSDDQHHIQHEEEHLYHVLENNRAPCSSEVIRPDPNAPELPPPLEPDSQDNDTPPVYQDITELSYKPNKLVDCDKSDQQCQHGVHTLHTNSDTVTLSDEKRPDYFVLEGDQGLNDGSPSPIENTTNPILCTRKLNTYVDHTL